MIDQITTQFYQNENGEISAIVEETKDNRGIQRLILNIESMKYTSEGLYEQALNGFSNFKEFSSADYGGLCFNEIMERFGFESGENRIIASISIQSGSEFMFDSMNDFAKELFSPMKEWTKEE